MLRKYTLILNLSIVLVLGCREVEDPTRDLGYDFQPLEVGNFWEYAVEETIVFGENDSETSNFFIRDKVDYTYRNEEGEIVYVILREKGISRSNYISEGNYALFIRNNALVRMQNNERVVMLAFPPRLGRSWDGRVYSSNQSEQFEIDLLGGYTLEDRNYTQAARVLQEEDDDLITFRDKRYDVYVKGIGQVEHYYEVLTYCSRNDCLGQQLVDSGRKTHMKIINYGRN
ncbi:hypothetical protein SAMN06295967_106132 [Belliella buryatensis]|uniref:Lipoprotein n=1 Tax=Belliella buryatensis TaxID=1500549 RepID=A0A239D609_9BACT|nr:hypothetical protein [Belliella buryatensis]SNS27582.1 hypothetical protein SAMN06295967_106132 [Belliella buryatensis]